MSSTRADFALLLASPDPVEADLAQGLLSSAGIPCMLHGQDRDLAEFGAASHGSVARPDLLVPKSALTRARELLGEAWEGGPIADEDPDSSRAMRKSSRRSAFLWFLILFLVVPTILEFFFAGQR